MVNVEPAFPRGHKVSTQHVKNRVNKPKISDKHFGATVLPETKVRSLRPEERRKLLLNEKKIDETETQQALDASNLSLNKLSSGMLVLGCVRRITKTELELVFPGRIKGRVPISNISNAYSNRLQDMINSGITDCPSLNDLYSVGELVYAKLLKKKVMEVETRLTFSLNPSDLHKTFVHWQLVPGLVLTATIVAKEDYGYTMDVGVHNVSAFLSFENLGQNEEDVGRNLVCSIVSVSQRDSGATVILKAFDPDAPRVLDVEEANLDTIVPGCKLMFTVAEPVAHGLRGMLFEDTAPAYVNETMLTKVWSTPAKYSMFKKIPATLLYVMPLTKQVFVSLRPYPKNRVEVNVTIGPGTIIEKAYVKYCDRVGVWLQFQNKHRALLPRNTIMKQAASSGGQVDESFVMGNFQIGSAHKVLVSYHHLFEDTYVVNNNSSYVDDSIQSPDDIIIGNIYKCRVHRIIDGGAFVTVGNVRGVVSQENYDRKHPVKLHEILLVRAVYREIDTPFVKFTNIPALLDEKASILYDWDQLDASKTEQSFVGIIFKITNYIIVRFFNGMNGIMEPSRYNSRQDIAHVAQLGVNTVEKFTVISFDKASKRIWLSRAIIEEKIESAVVVNATVRCVHATGVDVETEDGETGTIPSECFSEFGEHNSLYMRLFQEGNTINVVKTSPGTYSFRLVPYFKTHPMSIESVEKGALLKGSCITVNGVLYVTPLLSNFSERYEIKTKENYRKVEDGSVMMMRVLNVKKNQHHGYDLHVSTALDIMCKNGIDDVYNFMMEYMKDVNDLIQRYQREEKYTFANFTIGQHVECVVESIVPMSNKLVVKVHAIDKECTAKGIATAILPHQPASSYKIGKKVPGRVVWIDVEQKLVHVCVDQSLFDRFEALGTKYLSHVSQVELPCWVLFANNYVRLCCNQSGTPKSLLVVPVKHHYNDMIDNADTTTNAVKVQLIKRLGEMVFAAEEQTIQFYNMCRTQANAATNHSLVRCRLQPDKVDSMLEEEETDVTDESENDSDGDSRNGENEKDEDASYDSMDEDEEEEYVYNNDESDDEMSAKMPTALGTSNGKQQKEGAGLKPHKNGNVKSIMKRKAVAEYKESASQVQLPLKQKKKKTAPAEVLETAPVAKVPKMASKKTKKSILLLGKEEKTKKPQKANANLKKKSASKKI